jgi:hypothetical protein
MKQVWTHCAAAMLALVLIPIVDWVAIRSHSVMYGWLAIMVLVVVFSAIVGHAIVGCWRGVLIDARNVISLSRFQMLLWTAIVLSAFVTAALYNVFAGVDEPLGVQVPSTMWALMGVSTTSLVGAPMLLAQKTSNTPSAQALADTKDLLASRGEIAGDTKVIGQVIGNTDPNLAKWSDMFTGDETSNGAHIDLAKLQMFFFTLLVALSYCVVLFHMFRFAQADGITLFPKPDQSTLALIGISHAGYLVNKTVSRP